MCGGEVGRSDGCLRESWKWLRHYSQRVECLVNNVINVMA